MPGLLFALDLKGMKQMRSVFLHIFVTIVAGALWAVLAWMGTWNGWMRPAIAPSGDAGVFAEAVSDAIDDRYNGNAAFVLIENGEPVAQHFASIGDPVDAETLFQVGSLSKWVSAYGVMKLVEQGDLDLDRPVSQYLTRWALPESAFDNDGVTVRRLLSHTAGLTDGLGYAGFDPDGEVQSLEASLTEAADASPGADGRVRVGLEPGAGFEYSGGGYTLLQLLIEEASGETFADFMQQSVFDPLDMQRSTFVYVEDGVANVAASYDVDGSKATRFRFTGLAPTALYTNAADMTKFIQAQLPGRQSPGVLSPETSSLMGEPHALEMGLPIWGLGAIIYGPNDEGGFIIGHDGSDEPAINSAARFDPASGDGIIILETGNELLATELAGDWIYWKTGRIDILTFTTIAEKMFLTIIIGMAVILLISLIIGTRSILRWRRRAE